MQNGYFLCADILGFSRIIKNLNHEQLDIKIAEWTDLINEAAEICNIKRYQLISDTVFAGVGKEKNDLKSLVAFAKELLNRGISKSLPIRGAITFGEFTWLNQQVYGRAVINAHTFEKKQNWIGIILEPNIVLIDNDYREMGIVLYPPPLRDTPITTCNVISWDIPPIEELMIKLTTNGLSFAGEPLDWNWGDKLGNTVIFGLYLEVMLKHGGQAPNNFKGSHPVHFIDAIFRNPIKLKA